MRPRKHTNTHILTFLEFSNDSNVSDPSPVTLIHPRTTKTYARLKKPQYLVTGILIYSCRSPYSRIASSDAQKPIICRKIYRIKEASTDFLKVFARFHHIHEAHRNLHFPLAISTQPIFSVRYQH